MINKKEKIFTINFDTSDPNKFHEFIVEIGNDSNKKKWFYWSRYLPNFYVLATLEDTYWDVNKLTKAICKYMDNNITFVIFEVNNVPNQGKMKTAFWDFWNNSQNLTGHLKNQERAQKLKKIKAYTLKKMKLKKREEALYARKVELQKALSLKKKEQELKEQEAELKKMEAELNTEEIIYEPPKKRRNWFS